MLIGDVGVSLSPEHKMSEAMPSIEPSGDRWAIKHGTGVLGYAETQSEARQLVESLADAVEVTPVDRRGPTRYRHMPKSFRPKPIAA